MSIRGPRGLCSHPLVRGGGNKPFGLEKIAPPARVFLNVLLRNRASLLVQGVKVMMTRVFDNLQKFGREQIEASNWIAASIAKGLQAIAAEAAAYSNKSIEDNSLWMEKLLGASSIDEVVRIQSEHAQSAYADLVTEASKMGDLCTSLTKETLRVARTSLARAEGAAPKNAAKVQAAVSQSIAA